MFFVEFKEDVVEQLRSDHVCGQHFDGAFRFVYNLNEV